MDTNNIVNEIIKILDERLPVDYNKFIYIVSSKDIINSIIKDDNIKIINNMSLAKLYSDLTGGEKIEDPFVSIRGEINGRIIHFIGNNNLIDLKKDNIFISIGEEEFKIKIHE